ncbi:hypothetical protein [Sphingobacterium sp. UBA6320]|uniref:hypothetical protein n=1 Tax=Sphingobacterium sp. UBA6320 TaxID=1947510 RepID=UPI0025EF05B0|nr:hypothetical protein [Sphingobacterium sp. UBA6320]
MLHKHEHTFYKIRPIWNSYVHIWTGSQTKKLIAGLAFSCLQALFIAALMSADRAAIEKNSCKNSASFYNLASDA